MQDFVDNTKKAMKLDRKKVREWAEQYLMENVNELFEKWWRELHDLYLSTKDSNKKAFNKIEKLDAKKSD
jgi:hypothetical protein